MSPSGHEDPPWGLQELPSASSEEQLLALQHENAELLHANEVLRSRAKLAAAEHENKELRRENDAFQKRVTELESNRALTQRYLTSMSRYMEKLEAHKPWNFFTVMYKMLDSHGEWKVQCASPCLNCSC